jgi:hypothetical protein
MRTTKKQTKKQGTAMAKGAKGPRAKFSAKKFARIPEMIAGKNQILVHCSKISLMTFSE